MTSRERLLAAIEHRPVDRVPLCFEGVCHGGLVFLNHRYPDPFERARHYLEEGVDVALRIAPPAVSALSCRIRQIEERWPDEPAPLLIKDYITPAGTLRQAIRRTDDYPYDQVPLFADHHVPRSRSRCYLVSGETDLPALRHVLRPPRGNELTAFHERAEQTKRFCNENGIMLAGHYPGVGDPLMWMSGVEGVLLAAMDTPGFFQTYVDTVARWSRLLLEILIDAGVDVVVRRGWYESTDFWSPSLYQRYLAGPLKEEVRIAHQSGVKLSYVMNSGALPLLPIFQDLGFDILSNIDPLASGMDLRRIKQEIGGTICLCGGLNNTRVLEQGSEEAVVRAVQEALEILAPDSGFILSPGDSVGFVQGLDEKIVRRNIRTTISAWKRMFRDG